MVKVDYFVESLQFSQKLQKVMAVFKRIPTKDQLDKFAAEQEEKKNNPSQVEFLDFMSMISIFEHQNHEPQLELNWDRVRIVVKPRDIDNLGLKIGGTVQLDIPEHAIDIIVVKD